METPILETRCFVFLRVSFPPYLVSIDRVCCFLTEKNGITLLSVVKFPFFSQRSECSRQHPSTRTVYYCFLIPQLSSPSFCFCSFPPLPWTDTGPEVWGGELLFPRSRSRSRRLRGPRGTPRPPHPRPRPSALGGFVGGAPVGAPHPHPSFPGGARSARPAPPFGSSLRPWVGRNPAGQPAQSPW